MALTLFRNEPRALAAATVFGRETVTRLAPAAQTAAQTVPPTERFCLLNYERVVPDGLADDSNGATHSIRRFKRCDDSNGATHPICPPNLQLIL